MKDNYKFILFVIIFVELIKCPFAFGSVKEWLMSVPDPQAYYKVLNNGIVCIEEKNYTIYIKPLNDIVIKEGWFFMLFFPVFRSFDVEGINNQINDSFKIHMVVIPRENRVVDTIFPMRVYVNGEDKLLSQSFAFPVEKKLLPFNKEKQPYSKGFNPLFYGDDYRNNKNIIPVNSLDNFVIMKDTGFELVFQCKAPLPGKDRISIIYERMQICINFDASLILRGNWN